MIIDRAPVLLTEVQKRMLRTGWGDSAADDVMVESMKYESGNRIVNGYLAKPRIITNDLPLIIWNRGGNRNEGAIDEFLANGIFGEIASWGYIVLASQYRKDDLFGGDDVNDVTELLKLAEMIEHCDVTRTGMEGWSRGGMMTYKVLALTDVIKCAVVVAGVANLLRTGNEVKKLVKVYGKYFEEGDVDGKLRERSAIYIADRLSKRTPLLLMHGTGDDIVPHLDSVELYEVLKKDKSRIVDLILFEGGDHYLRKFRKEVSKLKRSWYDRFLKNELI